MTNFSGVGSEEAQPFAASSFGGYGGGAARGRGFSPFGPRMIGNRGGVMAPPSPDALAANGRSPMGSLDGLYASNTTDPNTGLRLNPNGFDIMQKQGQLQRGGDLTWERAQAQGGPQDQGGNFQALGAFNAYTQGQQSHNPILMKAAADAIRQQKNERDADFELQRRGRSNSGVRDWMANPGTMDDSTPRDWMKNPGRMAKGGPVAEMNPYLVGEEGPEVLVSDEGTAEILGANGPEIRTFDTPGKIIPNHKIKPMVGGGRTLPSMYSTADDQQDWFKTTPQVMSPYGAAYSGLWDALGRGVNALGSRGHTGFQQAPAAPAVADLLTPENYGEAEQEVAIPPSTRRRQSSPLDFYNPAIPFIPLPMSNRTPAADIPMPEPAPVPQDRAFQNQYGTGSVTYGQPKKEAIIEGLPASEYFQRAANRQGANKFASPEDGYHPERLAKQYAANDRAFALNLPTRRLGK